MKLPKLDDLMRFQNQWSVYTHPADKDLVVLGPPGSGKTTLAVFRARFAVNHRQSAVIVTRNRMLAALASHLGGGIEATTMHKLVATDHQRRLKRFVPEHQPKGTFAWKWEEILAAYASMSAAPFVDHLIIDEGQDLPLPFYEWARRFGGRVITVFADEDQAIEARATPRDICSALNVGEAKLLQENHRNTPEIARVAEHFHQGMTLPPALVQRPPGDETPTLVALASNGAVASRVATRFLNRGEAIGVVVQKKADVHHLTAALKAVLSGQRVDHYTSDTAQDAELSIRLLEPGVTVVTGESVKGLEFDAVFLLDLQRSLPRTLPADHRRLYMLCSRARDMLTLVDLPPSLSAAQLADLPPPPILRR